MINALLFLNGRVLNSISALLVLKGTLLHSISALLVLNGTLVNSINALLVDSQTANYYQRMCYMNEIICILLSSRGHFVLFCLFLRYHPRSPLPHHLPPHRVSLQSHPHRHRTHLRIQQVRRPGKNMGGRGHSGYFKVPVHLTQKTLKKGQIVSPVVASTSLRKKGYFFM